MAFPEQDPSRSSGRWFSELTHHRRAWRAGLLAGLLAAASAARADDPGLYVEKGVEPGRVTAQEHPFAFVTDPSTPSARDLAVSYMFGLGSGISEDRPIPVNMAAANGSHTFSLAYGITSGIAPFAAGTFAEDDQNQQTSILSAGLAWQVNRPGAPFKLMLSAAGTHEGQTGANGVTTLVATSVDLRELRLAANVRADKTWATDRDKLDWFVLMGTSYRLGAVRVGAEYVGQDLEAMGGDDAEGGARHSLGPTLALDLDHGRYQLVVGSGFGLNARTPQAIVRAGLTFTY
jgi:hypothetical protein